MSATAEEKVIRFTCLCGQVIEAPEEMAGQVVECPDCQRPVLAKPAGQDEKKETRRIATAVPRNSAAKEHEFTKEAANSMSMLGWFFLVISVLCAAIGAGNDDPSVRRPVLLMAEGAVSLSLIALFWYQMLRIRASLEEANYLKRHGSK